MPWMVAYGAMLHNLCHVTSDGRTPWEKRKGRRFGRDLPAFAENVMFLCPNSLGRDRGESRWEASGVFVGIIVESTEMIIATDQGAIKARSFRRKVDGERWNKEYLATVRGVPWEPTPGATDE